MEVLLRRMFLWESASSAFCGCWHKAVRWKFFIKNVISVLNTKLYVHRNLTDFANEMYVFSSAILPVLSGLALLLLS